MFWKGSTAIDGLSGSSGGSFVRDTMLEEAQNPAVAHGIKEAFPFSRKK
jgi:hypothetical protein